MASANWPDGACPNQVAVWPEAGNEIGLASWIDVEAPSAHG
jgi:hypothetical protein